MFIVVFFLNFVIRLKKKSLSGFEIKTILILQKKTTLKITCIIYWNSIIDIIYNIYNL